MTHPFDAVPTPSETPHPQELMYPDQRLKDVLGMFGVLFTQQQIDQIHEYSSGIASKSADSTTAYQLAALSLGSQVISARKDS